MPLQAGVVLEGRYRVEGLLGHGGMGAVYRAWDERLRMVVALKENALAGPDARAQFEREALMLARLHHSNLPKVIDHFVTAEGSQYLVMTFVEGHDLAQLLAARGRQSPAEVRLEMQPTGRPGSVVALRQEVEAGLQTTPAAVTPAPPPAGVTQEVPRPVPKDAGFRVVSPSR